MDNRRNFSRVKFVTDTKIILSGTIDKSENVKQIFEAEMADISLKGALLHPRQEVSVGIGDEFDLSFFLPASDVTLTFKCIVAHSHENNLGVKFICEDIDTLTHLRRLLELNLGDYEKVKNELPFLIEH